VRGDKDIFNEAKKPNLLLSRFNTCIRLLFSCWLVIRRASILCDETVTLSEGLYYLEAMGSAGGQLGKLLKLRREMEEAEKNEDLARAMEGALEEVLKEWGGWIES